MSGVKVFVKNFAMLKLIIISPVPIKNGTYYMMYIICSDFKYKKKNIIFLISNI